MKPNVGLGYVVVSPECGPQYRIYTNEDTEGPNAIEGIEHVLEQQSYWFAQLGKIPGERISYPHWQRCRE
jgi:hypothetical protein